MVFCLGKLNFNSNMFNKNNYNMFKRHFEIKIKSTSTCVVKSSKSLKGLFNPGLEASIYDILSSLFRIALIVQTNDNNKKCAEEISVIYHVDQYIYVEAKNGELEVEYIFNRKRFFNRSAHCMI